ncbi:MAG: outer membrane lipoprotein carrier protein LolA, partial [Acidobacteriota bacterium]|nr:outer membrane lipoprotein carrier protein LolA [Acidobacteriota bacterium]
MNNLRAMLKLLILLLSLGCAFASAANAAVAVAVDVDIEAVIAGMERRYAQAETAVGSFRQVYRAPGMVQEESGVFKLKRPGLMRWEYQTPEAKLFVADGKECFLYAPRDRQVTVHPLTPADLKRTPLAFLLGGGNVRRDYRATVETEYKPTLSGTLLLRLTPVREDEEYAFVMLELDDKVYDIRRVVIRER